MKIDKTEPKKIFLTGGAGFIGSALVRFLIAKTENIVLNYDKLTYAASESSLESVSKSDRYHFVKGDICDAKAVGNIFDTFKPDAVMHLAAESHVDRSIDHSADFIQTNIVGTHVLLDSAEKYRKKQRCENFRFLHVSTDEVYGSLGETGYFTEKTSYQPNSPYSASKASSDHLVRAWNHTYGLKTLITNCSNNYGPFHFPEKLIPNVILNALDGHPITVYGDGKNIRDWLYVDDHVEALYRVLMDGTPGETYNIGGNCEKTNIDVVRTICQELDKIRPLKSGKSYSDQIIFVQDRPGHDRRYAINAEKIKKELAWQPSEVFENGISKTIQWYLDNEFWYRKIQERFEANKRLGLN